MNTQGEFTPQEIEKFDPCEKLALVATVNSDGTPHVSLLTTMQATGPATMAFGEFSRGASKENLKKNPQAGWLIITLDKKLWRGQAVWKDFVKEGEEYQRFNQKPMFRYNTYFGINTVHRFDLVHKKAEGGLPMAAILGAMLRTSLAGGRRRDTDSAVLNDWSRALINKTGSLKFLSFVGADGYPRIIPALQVKAAGQGRLYFSDALYRAELAELKAGDSVALFAMNMGMESVLTRGRFAGFGRRHGLRCGEVELDFLYNTMIPKQGQMYPELPLRAVSPSEFALES